MRASGASHVRLHVPTHVTIVPPPEAHALGRPLRNLTARLVGAALPCRRRPLLLSSLMRAPIGAQVPFGADSMAIDVIFAGGSAGQRALPAP